MGLRHIGPQVLFVFRSYVSQEVQSASKLWYVHTLDQRYTHHARGTHITPGVHTSHQGYTHHARGTHITPGVHTSRQGYTHHTRGTHITPGVHTSRQGYTHQVAKITHWGQYARVPVLSATPQVHQSHQIPYE